MSAYTNCPQQGSGNEATTGIVTRNVVTPSASGSRAGWLAGASQTFTAPEGTGIGQINATTSLRRYPSGYWTVGFVGWSGDTLANFFGASLLWGNTSGDSGGGAFEYNGINANFNAGGRTRVRLDTRCGDIAGCLTDWLAIDSSTNRSHQRAYATMTNVSVQVLDSVPPSVTGGGPAWGSGWQRATKTVHVDAWDSTGIKAVSATLDGIPIDTRTSTCDFTQRAPCPNRSDDLAVVTAATADGPHSLAVNALDTANNVRSSAVTIYTDNSPPGRPTAIAVDGGDGWRAMDEFAVTWNNPGGQASPIVRANYELCSVANPASCERGFQDGVGISRLSKLAVTEVGAYTVRITLQDEAGNSLDAQASDPVTLRFDDTIPAEAGVAEPQEWLNSADAAAFAVTVTPQTATPAPPSGIAGYSITTDGSTPDTSIDLPGPTPRLTPPRLSEGLTTVRVRAITGAAVAADEIGSATIRVDRQAPSVAVVDGPDANVWQRTPVKLALSGTDQEGLSSLEGELPSQKGGWIAYAVDDASPVQQRGATADVTVSGDGAHSVTYAATDRAGNISTQRVANFRIDATPPDTLGFEAPDPEDPREISAIATDLTSGIADGEIEIRLAGTHIWKQITTTRAHGRLLARIDDDGLARGIYLLRVRASDVAGNERVTDRLLSGSRADDAFVIDVPIRQESRLVVDLPRHPITRRSCEVVIAEGQAVNRCRWITVAAPKSGPVELAFGDQGALSGQLITTSGAPLSAATVVISATNANQGAVEQQLASVRTDAAGRFKFSAPAGPSRTITVRYGGSGMTGTSAAKIRITVPAKLALSVDRRSVNNGSSVTFKGRLIGQQLPLTGKLVTLQAFYRGKWRAFATTRATAAGKFTYSYRFEATHGRVTYRFRAQAQPEPSYPYGLGSSPEVAVTVTG